MIKQNLQILKNRIHLAAQRCGRNPSDIQLVAVSKKFPASSINEAFDVGQQIFGENYIQEAAEKIEQTNPKAVFHFIGHLQSNKVKLAARLFQMIETIDRLKLAQALDKELKQLNRVMDILMQINIGEEPQKSGVLPGDTQKLLRGIRPLSNLRIQGLMAIPPQTESPEKTRYYFRSLHQLALEPACRECFFNNSKIELSMGMSDDFEIAIEEGATIIRIGTAIFGQRPLPAHYTESPDRSAS